MTKIQQLQRGPKMMMPRRLDTIQDFLWKLSMKPLMHLWETTLSSLFHGIVRPTKITKGLTKNWAHFEKI